MQININGVTRDMTAEEMAEHEAFMASLPTPVPSQEERLAELEEALELLLTGVTE